MLAGQLSSYYFKFNKLDVIYHSTRERKLDEDENRRTAYSVFDTWMQRRSAHDYNSNTASGMTSALCHCIIRYICQRLKWATHQLSQSILVIITRRYNIRINELLTLLWGLYFVEMITAPIDYLAYVDSYYSWTLLYVSLYFKLLLLILKIQKLCQSQGELWKTNHWQESIFLEQWNRMQHILHQREHG